MRAMLRRASILGILIAGVLASVPSAAATLPVHAEVRAGRCVEPASFRRSVANRYQVEFIHIVAADIDSDGDIDVIATTDRTFTLWLNDGHGHLTSDRPSTGSGVDAGAPASTWRQHSRPIEPSTNDEAPSSPVLVEQAHAPPALVSSRARQIDSSFPRLDRDRSRASRAPPQF